jgi:hypothetical protein
MMGVAAEKRGASICDPAILSGRAAGGAVTMMMVHCFIASSKNEPSKDLAIQSRGVETARAVFFEKGAQRRELLLFVVHHRSQDGLSIGAIRPISFTE